ncbi:MAG: thioredoxin domain-containing protein [bacterium]
MADDATTNSGKGEGAPSPMGVPVAIVIAGVLIAAAVYFGGKGAPADQPLEADVAAEFGEEKVAGATVGDIRPVDETDHVMGAVDAKVTVIEYSDLECPFCKRFHLTAQQLVSEYPDDVRWVFRHFPLEQLHSQASKEAEATECAGEQSKFWEMLDAIFEATPSNDGLDLTTLPALAGQAGVANIQQFQTCLDTGLFADRVAEDLADAEEAGGMGTPYSVIIGPNGEKEALSGAQPYDAVKAAVGKYLQ